MNAKWTHTELLPSMDPEREGRKISKPRAPPCQAIQRRLEIAPCLASSVTGHQACRDPSQMVIRLQRTGLGLAHGTAAAVIGDISFPAGVSANIQAWVEEAHRLVICATGLFKGDQSPLGWGTGATSEIPRIVTERGMVGRGWPLAQLCRHLADSGIQE